MITIVRAVQTSIACPAQWDLWDADGNYYYARYRNGCGSLRQYEDENWVEAAGDTLVARIASFEYGDELAGDISLNEFARLAGIEIAPEATRAGFGEHVRSQLEAEGIVAEPGSELDGIYAKWDEASG